MGIGKQNNSKCNQEEGFGIFGTADEKSQFWKGKNLHVYIYTYIFGNCTKPVLHWVHSLFIFMNPKNLQGFHWFSRIWAGPNIYSTLRS